MRIKTGIYGWEMPDRYEVNVVPKSARVMQWRTTQSEELLDNVVRQLCDCLEFLGAQFHNTGKFIAAAEIALIHRYLHQNCSVFTGDERDDPGGALSFAIHELNRLPIAKQNYVFSGVDELQKILEHALRRESNDKPHP
jgi:fido (protein-threonine AMPylation protein)